MSKKNFVSFGDSETLLSEVGSALRKRATSFVGSTQEWESLSPTDKAKYEVVFINDDTIPNVVRGDVVKGYYKQSDGKFYVESTYTTEVTPKVGSLFLELSTFHVYMYDSINHLYVDISHQNVESDTTSVSGASFYKNGNNCQITFNSCIAASIPPEYRPVESKYLGFVLNDNSKNPVLIYATADGNVTVQEIGTANVLSTYSLYGTLTYVH